MTLIITWTISLNCFRRTPRANKFIIRIVLCHRPDRKPVKVLLRVISSAIRSQVVFDVIQPHKRISRTWSHVLDCKLFVCSLRDNIGGKVGFNLTISAFASECEQYENVQQCGDFCIHQSLTCPNCLKESGHCEIQGEK